MSLNDLIPTMNDADLATFRANAVRQMEVGDAKRQTAASEILPVIDEEIEARALRAPPVVAKTRRKTAVAEPATAE